LSQSNFDRLLQKYLAGECTEAEEKLVLEWYEAMIRNSDLHLSEGDRSQIEERLWNTIQTNVQAETATAQPAKVKPITARTWFRVTAAAAVLTVIATGIVLFRHQPRNNQQLAVLPAQRGYDSLVNGTNSEKRVQLADSTLIMLQPGATVYYPPVFTGTTREVFLHGSAFFNVYHNAEKHFKVHLNDGLTTEVLGTSFQITQHQADRNIEVAVVTGKVLVYQQHEQQNDTEKDSRAGVILTRNNKVTFNAASNQLITGIVDNPQPLPKTKTQAGSGSRQRDDPFVFEEASLQQVLQTLSDAYGILITVENEQVANYHFTGDLSKYSLFTQLEYICKSTQTIYEINGSQIIIKETRTGDNP
jgi:ferric-dicitrate binding protein FerR (iron transport regulator)